MTTNSERQEITALQDRYGLKAVSYLEAGAAELPHDISERLRAARTQALARRKIAKIQATAWVLNTRGSAVLGGPDDNLGWWMRMGMALPLVMLVVGLVFIDAIQADSRTRELAEVDAALLTDELPPAAFADPGFLQFLKTGH